jgi:alkylation response protein AidB-like acyl-CoA dehydrogenase
MRVWLTEEQKEIGIAAADFLDGHVAVLGPPVTGGADPTPDEELKVWRDCGSLGWFSLGVPEKRGGVGYGPTEELVLFRELGRHLARGPFISTVAAGWIAASTERTDIAEDVFAGRQRVGLGVGEYVLDAESGGYLVVPDDGGLALHRVTGSVTSLKSVDATVRLGRDVASEEIVRADDPLLVSRLELLLAAADIGIADATRDMSVAYAQTRIQFGKPIGAFQAVKHRCADMASRCYAAYSQTLFAASHLERRSSSAAFHAGAARLVASSAARRNAADNIQNHGAIGFTQEHVAAWFARRAQVLQQSLDPLTTSRRVAATARERYETLGGPIDDWFSSP